jgi:hypothetical protein
MPAPTTSTKTIAAASASFNAMRRIFLARNKNIPPKSSRIKIAPTVLMRFPSKPLTAHCLPATACRFLFLITRAHRGFDVTPHVEVTLDLDA